ncbi:MAG: FeoA family protein [Saccharofermentanales bacterium]
MTLDKIKAGNSARITAIAGQGPLRRRLLDMGLTPRTIINVVKLAPMGDPMILALRGYELSIRKEDAGLIAVENIRETHE